MSLKIDYTSGWTETDTGSYLTVAASQITAAALTLNAVSYVHKDYTASYFSGDIDFTFQFKCTSSTDSEIVFPIALLNGSVGAIGARIAANDDCIYLKYSNATFTLGEQNSSGSTTDTSVGASPAIAEGTEYTIRFVRDEEVGTYGTLYAFIYLEPEMLTLVDTLTVTLTEKADFQYLFAFSSNGASSGAAFNGYVKNLCLDANPYTLGTLRTKVRDALNETTDALYTDTEIDRAINDAIRDICKYGQVKRGIEALTATGSTRYISYTGAACRALEYKPAAGTRKSLIARDVRSFGTLQFKDSSTPAVFEDFGGKVWVEPIPSTTWAFDAFVISDAPSDLTLDVQVPLIPPAFRGLIVPCAVSSMVWKDGKTAVAQQMRARFENELYYLSQLLLENVPDSVEDTKYR